MDTTDSENPAEVHEVPTAKETSKNKKEKSKLQKSRRNAIQEEVMNVVRERQEAKEKKIEVPLDEWMEKISLISSLQQSQKMLREELRNAKEDIKIKEAHICQLQKSISNITDAMKNGVSNTNAADTIPRGKVDIGEGVLVSEFGLNDIRTNTALKPSKIVSGLATLIFNDIELRTRTISGKPCNLNAKRSSSIIVPAQLDARKLEALKAEYARILERRPPDERCQYSKWKEFLNRKLKYEKERFRKQEKEDRNEETSSIASGAGPSQENDVMGLGENLSQELVQETYVPPTKRIYTTYFRECNLDEFQVIKKLKATRVYADTLD